MVINLFICMGHQGRGLRPLGHQGRGLRPLGHQGRGLRPLGHQGRGSKNEQYQEKIKLVAFI
jgi:hypothetical protein